MEHYLDNPCPCGKVHTAAIDDVVIGSGAIARLPEFIGKYTAKKPFLLADRNTWKAAGQTVADILRQKSICFSRFVFEEDALEPDEKAMNAAFDHFDSACDLVIGIGSGVINDLGKLLSSRFDKKYIIVATAPSMDGYASATSSMNVDGLKVSLNSRCAHVIIGDINVLKNAPEHMLKAGLGDMLAKYVSIAEWRISHLINGEYYCPQVARLIRNAVQKCVDNAHGLLKREEAAVQAVFEGLVIGGIAMAYAGVSRPASGVEHYFSHVWDMRGLEFGTQVDLHGIQCAIATYKAAQLYEVVKTVTPDKEKAFSFVDAFDYTAWKKQLLAFLGKSGQTMIDQEEKEHKYDKSTHPARFQRIADNWNEIVAIIGQEIPSAHRLGSILDTIGISRDLNSIGVERPCARLTFQATKDIRDKYVLSRLAWDLGILDQLTEIL